MVNKGQKLSDSVTMVPQWEKTFERVMSHSRVFESVMTHLEKIGSHGDTHTSSLVTLLCHVNQLSGDVPGVYLHHLIQRETTGLLSLTEDVHGYDRGGSHLATDGQKLQSKGQI